MVAGPDAFYTILNKNGRSTCAIYQMDEEMQQMMRGQAAWHSYFTVESADDAFSVWQPKSEIGAQIFGEPGALAWNELYTHDTDAAEKFYAGLFGWSANKTASADGGDYVEYQLGGKSAAGMMAIRKEWGEVPPTGPYISPSPTSPPPGPRRRSSAPGRSRPCWRSRTLAGLSSSRTRRAPTSP